MQVKINAMDTNMSVCACCPTQMPVNKQEAVVVLEAIQPYMDAAGRLTDLEEVKSIMSNRVKTDSCKVVFAGLWQQIVEWQEVGATYLTLTISGGDDYAKH